MHIIKIGICNATYNSYGYGHNGYGYGYNGYGYEDVNYVHEGIMTLKVKVKQVLCLQMCHCSHRTNVTSKTLSNLSWMLCCKHVLVIHATEYCDIVIKMHQ